MRRDSSSWRKAIARLRPQRNRRQRPNRQAGARRRSWFEALEQRRMLTSHAIAPSTPSPSTPSSTTPSSTTPAAISQSMAVQEFDVQSVTAEIAAASTSSSPLLVNDLTDLDDNRWGFHGDLGTLSLREAIRLANADTEPDTITFEPALFSTPQTITLGDTDGDGVPDLTATELLITSAVSIIGPGAEQLTIDAQSASRVFHNTGQTLISNLKITGGKAMVGGGLYNDAGSLTIVDVDVSGNEATYSGGGIYNLSADLSLRRSTIHNNVAAVTGGGIDSGDASIDISQSTIYGNTSATHNGGGIHLADGRLQISASSLFDNSAGLDGGGIYFSDGSMQISGSAFYDNSAGRDGGGIFAAHGALDVSQSTISSNTSLGWGGGLATRSVADLTHVTVTANQSSKGGGVWVQQNSLLLQNSIVAGNTRLNGTTHDDLQLASPVLLDATSSHNLFGWGGSGNFPHDPSGTGNLVGIDPLLAELGNYGGPTLSHALLPGSGAIDAGESFYALGAVGQSRTTDQRGTEFPRIVNHLPDIGAVERRIAVSIESGAILRIDDRWSHLDQIVLATTSTAQGNLVTINGAPIPFASNVVQGIEIFGGDGGDYVDLTQVDLDTFPSLLGNSITIYGGVGDDQIVGSPLVDIILGEAGQDRLHGNLGDDIYRFSGNVDLGVDFIFEIAGEGTDTLDFSGLDFGAGIDVDLSLGNVGQQVIDHDGVQLSLLPNNAANFENIVGTPYDDLLTGNQFANTIHGLDGNDEIFGRAGNDILDGGRNYFDVSGGRETLDGEEGSDTYLAVPGAAWTEFIENRGDDRYVFAADSPAANFGRIDILPRVTSGTDTLDFSGLQSRAVFSLADASRQDLAPDGGLLSLLATGAYIENLIGTEFDDHLTGNALANLIDGRGGNDTLKGEEGGDQLLGGAGGDTLYGGAGDDDLDGGPNTTADVLYGGSHNDIYRASSSAAITFFMEQDGNDAYVFAGENLGEVRMRLQGGNNNGIDVFDFSGMATRVDVALDLTNSELQDVTPDTDDLVLKLENSIWGPLAIENIIGSEFDDTLTGNQVANRLEGKGGDDILHGRSGDDVLDGGANFGGDHVYGESGHDSYLASAGSTETFFYDGSGNDEYIFGHVAQGVVHLTQAAPGDASGIDTLDFRGMRSGVTIDLADNQLQVVAAGSSELKIGLVNNSAAVGSVAIENVIGSHYDDHIIGNLLDNHLSGEDGRDRLETGGNSGNTPEVLDGGQGDDTLVVNSGSVATQLLETMGSDTFVFAAGNLGRVTIDAQFVAENQGIDTLDFSAVGSRVVVSLADAGLQNATPDTGDLQLRLAPAEIIQDPFTVVPVQIENIVGGSYHDELLGNGAANDIRGGAGNDLLRGGAGDDVLRGEGGTDSLHGESGNDRLLGGDHEDLLLGGAGNDLLDGGIGELSYLAGGADDDQYVVSDASAAVVVIAESTGGGVDTLLLSQSSSSQGANVDLDQGVAAPVFAGVTLDLVTHAQGELENIVGTSYPDRLYGSLADNLISGRGGDDLIFGRDGNDTLHGGSGNDTLFGGNDEDYLVGGSGDDELFGEASDDFLSGGDGDDALAAGNGSDVLDPGSGNNTLDEPSLPILDFAAGLAMSDMLLGSITYSVPDVTASVIQQGMAPQNKIYHTIASILGPAKPVDIVIAVAGQPEFTKTVTVLGADVDQQVLLALGESGFFAPGDFTLTSLGPVNSQETTVVEFTGAYATLDVSLDVLGGSGAGQQVYTVVGQQAAQAVDEIVSITSDPDATNCFFHLSYDGVVSAAIPGNATAMEIETAIEEVAAADVSVTKIAVAQWEVEFPAQAALPLLPLAAGPEVGIDWGDGTPGEAATLILATPYQLGTTQQIDIVGSHTYQAFGGKIIKVTVAGASESGTANPVLKIGARITAIDSDGDGITDDVELSIGTNPASADSDGDQLPDKYEFDSQLLDPTGPDAPDVDHDGLTNLQEFEIGTDPDLIDTDHDGLTDLQESDLDGDGLSYLEEIVIGTDPNQFDTDDDLLSDQFEDDSTYLDPTVADELEGDPDEDGLSNFLEQIFGTNPDEPDSDGDQVSDGDEVGQGSDPNLSTDFQAPDDSELVGLQLTVGDFSGSHSERYDLAVGALLHQAPEFGVVVTNLYNAFRSGRTYSIRLFHRGSNLSYPDYDYIADIDLPPETAGMIIVEDPRELLGMHYDRDAFFAQSSDPRSASFHTPLIDLDITRPGVVDAKEETQGVAVGINDDDDDQDGLVDTIDAAIVGENDVVAVTLRNLLPAALHDLLGEVRLSFPSDKIRIWDDPNYDPADPLSLLSKTEPLLPDFLVNDFTIDHTYYVEGLEVGVADIMATYKVYDQPGVRIKGATEVTDTVRVIVVAGLGTVDIQIDQLSEDLEGTPGAIVWRNSDFSNKIADPNDPHEPGLPLYVPDYQARIRGFANKLDPNYQADFTPGKVTVDQSLLEDHDLRFTFPESTIEIWTAAAWSDFESAGPGWYKIPQGIEVTPEATSFEFWIEGINNSATFATDSILVEVVPRDMPDLMPSAVDEAFYSVVETNFGVDGNRDAIIDFQSSHDRQLLFWYNSDREGLNPDGHANTKFDNFIEAEDTGFTGPIDFFGGRIAQKRDLEDFSHLQIEVHQHITDNSVNAASGNLPIGGQLEVSYRLALENTGGSSLNLFKTESEQVLDHVSSLLRAEEQVTREDLRAAIANIGDAELEHIEADINSFLFEANGSEVTQPTLVFITTIRYSDGSTTKKRHAIELELHDFKDFYSLYEVDYGQHDVGSADKRHELGIQHFPTPAAARDSRIVDQPYLGKHPDDIHPDNIILVHGWNHTPESKRAFAETAFKRLYWQGFRGHFVEFDWPTFADSEGPLDVEATGLRDGANLSYNPSELQAYRSGKALKEVLEELDGKKHLLAHSMGNVVVAEAFRQSTGELVDTYTAMEAAISAGAYGSDATDAFEITLRDPDEPNGEEATWPTSVQSNSRVDLLRHWPALAGVGTANDYYMAGTHAAAAKWINFYNPVDSATNAAWRTNNLIKSWTNVSDPGTPGPPDLPGINAFYVGVWDGGFDIGRIGATQPRDNMHWLFSPNSIWAYRYVHSATALTTISRVLKEEDRSQPSPGETLGWDNFSPTPTIANEDYWFHTDPSTWQSLTINFQIPSDPTRYEFLAFISQANAAALGNAEFPAAFAALTASYIDIPLSDFGLSTADGENPANHSFQFNHDSSTTWEFWKKAKKEIGFRTTHDHGPSAVLAPITEGDDTGTIHDESFDVAAATPTQAFVSSIDSFPMDSPAQLAWPSTAELGSTSFELNSIVFAENSPFAEIGHSAILPRQTAAHTSFEIDEASFSSLAINAKIEPDTIEAEDLAFELSEWDQLGRLLF